MSPAPRRWMRLAASLALVVLAAAPARAQDAIPNPDFETWTAFGPVGWVTNDFDTFFPVTQTATSFSGLSAAKGEALPFDRAIESPILQTAFHAFDRDVALAGWYQFAPLSGDVFHVQAKMFAAGAQIGAASLVISAAESTWTRFSAPITYTSPATPDSAFLLFDIESSVVGPIHNGSIYWLDLVRLETATGVGGAPPAPALAMEEAAPEPFGARAHIRGALPRAARVRLGLYDVTGREVRVLVDGPLPAGPFDAPLEGAGLPSGIYFARLEADGLTAVRRLVHVK